MKIDIMMLGELQTNCYLVYDEQTKRGFVVDPAEDDITISARLSRLEVVPEAILLTHGHFDHMMAVNALRERYHIPVYAKEEETPLLEDASNNLSALWAEPYTTTADIYVKDGQHLEIAGLTIRVLHTPGHTPGGVCYYLENEHTLLSGDTLFHDSYGRCDLPGGDFATLLRSLKRVLCLPEETTVYPGHGEETTIGHERCWNPAARGMREN